MPRTFLLFSLLAAAPQLTNAQLITNPSRASAAHDSLLQAASTVRQQVQARSARFETRAPHVGKRRQRVRGFAPGSSARFVWEEKTVVRRNGTTTVRFTALQNGKRVLRERLLNGQLVYLWLNTQPAIGTAPASLSAGPAASPVASAYGTYLHGGYVRWNGSYYVVPTARPGSSR